jgi:4-diphosphocytidyl-2-C-methyl-D-erythritol kinase
LTIALPARAKLNLDLAVLGRRDDGYHDVRTTLQAIDLHDLVIVERASETTLTTSGLALNTTLKNSCTKAHAALERAAKRQLPCAIHLHKRIPPGSGMGGASSDAATTLRAVAALHGMNIDLAVLAEEVGADVRFFLAGGTALAEGRGELLTPLATQPAWFALAWPQVELPTPDVYRAWDKTPGEPPNQLANAAFRVDPRLRTFAVSLGSGWQMTGSGSAFFKRCATKHEAIQASSALECWSYVAQAVGAWA